LNAPSIEGNAMSDPVAVDPKLLEILVCPLTKGPLIYDAKKQELLSKQAGLAYPIRDGIPIMLADEARPLTDDEMRG
jgi:uncharacterized protein YbaR (Trm112 family)